MSQHVGHGRAPFKVGAWFHVLGDSSLTRNFGSSANSKMPSQSCLTSDDCSILYHCASAYACLGYDEAMLTDLHVVSDLNEIIDLGSFPYTSLVKA